MPNIIRVYHKCAGNDRPYVQETIVRRRGNVKSPPLEKKKKRKNRPNADIDPIIHESKYINIHIYLNIIYYSTIYYVYLTFKSYKKEWCASRL